MKAITIIRAQVIIALLGALALNGLAQTDNTSSVQGTHLSAAQQFYQQRFFVNGQSIPKDTYDKALSQWQTLPRTVPQQPQLNSAVSGVKGTVWVPIGPSPIIDNAGRANNGRVAAIALNPFNPNVIYQGAEGGGVWRSRDGGTTWTPLFDQQPSLGIGEPSAIAIDPENTDTIYVGTSARFVQNISKGVLKSTDGGGSWVVLGSGFPADNIGNAQGLFSGVNISSVVVDPANSSVLYLAADSGVFRSTDGGRNWVLGNSAGGVAQSLALDATSPAANRILYAGINGSGIIRSTDGGQNWALVLSAATPAVAGALAGGSFGRVIVALAPPTTPANAAGIQVLYATMEGQGGAPDPVGLFESTDQGGTWTKRTATGLPGNTQGGYSMAMGVDPASPGDGANDIIYFGAVGYAKSVNSGNTFTALGAGMHVDFHSDFVFATQPSPKPSIVFAGNDGGIWKSLDGGTTWSGTGGALATINAGGLQTGLFYHLAVKNDATASVSVGALQDNGTPHQTSGLSWTDPQGGDGFDVVFDAVNVNNAYNSSGFWPAPCTRLFRSTDSGFTFPATVPSASDITPWGTTTDQGCYVAILATDPSNAGVVYASGSQNLWQSSNAGANWRIIFNQGVGNLDVARANSNNVVYAVGSQVFLSLNAWAATVGQPAGVTFANITRDLPNRTVSRVAFDPNDPTVIFAVLGGTGSGHVFRTTIGGTTWANISPPLDVPYNAIALDGTPTPTAIYVGHDLGVMRSVDGGASWTVLDDLHFPNVPVTDLAFNAQAGVLRAATFGRGVFELAAANGPVIAINAKNGLQFGPCCAGTPQQVLLQVFNVGNADLVINSVTRLMGSTDFSVLPNPATPLVIRPNGEVDFTIQYTPTLPGSQQATIRIASTDPGAPYFDLTATGSRAEPAIRVTGSTAFGDVCAGTVAEQILSICNMGKCNLTVTNVGFVPACQDFTLINSPFPAALSPGACLPLTIRLTPRSCGQQSCTLVVVSDDPAKPVVNLPVTANTPCAVIDVSPDLGFAPEVIQSVGPCSTALPFPISNKGQCKLTITSITIGGPNAGDFSLSGLPSFPIILEPGHVAGEGNLNVVFAPTALARARTATISVTYVSDPVSGATATITRALCGEGVNTGARVLVMQGGVPLAKVERIHLQRINANRNGQKLDSTDVFQDATLVTVPATPPCAAFQYHREYGTVSNPIQLLPGSYQVTVSAIINGKHQSLTAGFSVDTCDFNPTVVVNF